MKCKKIFFIIIIMLLFPSIALSHSGRTDSYGGHWNHSTGTYHYHSGKYKGTGEYTAPIEQGGVSINDNKFEDIEFTDISSLENQNSITSNERIGEIDYSTLENTVKNLSNVSKNLEEQVYLKQNTINDLIDEKNELQEQIYFLYKIGGIFIIIVIAYIFYLSKELDKYENILDNLKKDENKSIHSSNTTLNNNKATTQTNYNDTCPKCGGILQIKTGKYGKFLGCKNYPYCKYTKNIKNKWR